MKKLRYSQSLGRLWGVDGETLTRIGVGYSGYPPHTNRPEAETIKAAGPLPRGNYRVRLLGHHVRLGPTVFFLDPEAGTELFGRSGFLIHGDNEYGNNTASHGCVILSRKVRDRIAAMLPCTLEVVA